MGGVTAGLLLGGGHPERKRLGQREESRVRRKQLFFILSRGFVLAKGRVSRALVYCVDGQLYLGILSEQIKHRIPVVVDHTLGLR